MTQGKGFGGGTPGSGNIQTESRTPGTFEAISIEYPGAEIIIQQGDTETVQIEADDHHLPQLSTGVLSGRLTIKSQETDWKASVNPSQPVKISMTVKDVNEIVLSAPVGNLEVNDLQTDILDWATAWAYNTQAEIIPDVAHNNMLDPRWQSAAKRILAWLNEQPITDTSVQVAEPYINSA